MFLSDARQLEVDFLCPNFQANRPYENLKSKDPWLYTFGNVKAY